MHSYARRTRVRMHKHIGSRFAWRMCSARIITNNQFLRCNSLLESLSSLICLATKELRVRTRTHTWLFDAVQFRCAQTSNKCSHTADYTLDPFTHTHTHSVHVLKVSHTQRQSKQCIDDNCGRASTHGPTTIQPNT